MYCFDLITCILSLSFIFGLIVHVTVIIISPTLFDHLNHTFTLCRGEIKFIIMSSLSQVIPPMSSTATCKELNLRGRTVDYGLVITDSENVLNFLKSSSSTMGCVVYHQCVFSFCSQVTVANFTFFSSNLMAHGKIVLDMCNCFHDRCGEILDFSTSVMWRNLWYL